MSHAVIVGRLTARPVASRLSSSVTFIAQYHLDGLGTNSHNITPHARSFSSGSPRYGSLISKPADAKAFKGVEGPHRKDITRSDEKVGQANDVSAMPAVIQGEWSLSHPVYSRDELKAVEILHRDAKTFGEKAAAMAVHFARKAFDWISGYKHKPIPPNLNMTVEELIKGGYILTEKQWLARILFLESIAGVPGMVGGTLRHLRSLRLMKRDSGWIHTLLEEAENERMHLMTFMAIKKPSIFFRLLVLGAQGVFYNAFFFAYLMSPRLCHRFVGYLEEEAVITYTRCIKDLEAGRIPGWTDHPAPEIAKDYWRLKPDAKMIDVVYAVRSDEVSHRFVNHSLANLNYNTDVNPFALREPDMHVKGQKLCFEREEAQKYVRESRRLMEQGAEPQDASSSAPTDASRPQY